jgi:transcriptional regulator with XRE-family HTH domain
MKAQALVAWNLRRLRVARGRSQEDLALEAEVDRSYMSRLERGRVNPTVGVLEQIAGVLDAHIIEFFIEPAEGELPPEPLRGGRRKRG